MSKLLHLHFKDDKTKGVCVGGGGRGLLGTSAGARASERAEVTGKSVRSAAVRAEGGGRERVCVCNLLPSPCSQRGRAAAHGRAAQDLRCG